MSSREKILAAAKVQAQTRGYGGLNFRTLADEGTPAVSIESFTVNGTPWSGPRERAVRTDSRRGQGGDRAGSSMAGRPSRGLGASR